MVTGQLTKEGNPPDWDRVVKVTCHTNCSYQKPCILNAYIKDDVITRLEQSNTHPHSKDPDLPDWNPRGCQKGLISALRTYDASRILHPYKRVGDRGEGKWQQLSWDEALGEIADTLIDVITSDGVDTIVRSIGSGTLGSESVGFDALMGLLGVPFTSIMADLGDEHQGTALVFGQPYVGGSVDNWWYADIVLIWGGNPTYTNISNYHLLTEGRYNGTRVVCIAPDYSPSAIHADLWVPVNIGTDAALALGMAQVIVEERLYREDFVREQTDLPILVRMDTRRFLREGDLKSGGLDDIYYFWDSRTDQLTAAPRLSLRLDGAVPALEGTFTVMTSSGPVQVQPVFERLRSHLQDYTPEKASRITGVSPSMIRRLAREIAQAGAVTNLTTFNWGKFYHGHEIERAIVLLFALCGHMGRKGAVYNGFTGGAADTLAIGDMVAGWILLRSAAASDPRYAEWKSQGFTDEMIILEYAREAMATGRIVSSSLFHYFHSGLLELSLKHNSWDPSLKRPLESYLKEALDKGWHKVWPKQGKDPRILIQWGGSILRRGRATGQMLKTLLPKLKLLLAVDTRWSSTALYADYVLPAAGWYEKFSFYGPQKVDYPYAFVVSKAVDPLGESKGEWEIACLMARKIEERARARGVLSFLHSDGSTRRLDNLYDRVTSNGMYTEDEEEAVARDYYLNTANVEQMPWEEAKEKGLVALTSLGLTARSIGNACDVTPGEPLVPLTWHIEKKEPYPTQTRRMQFYIDHSWYLEFGEELPVQKEDPKAGGDYPLRLTGGHARWSIHSCQVDDPVLLRLQRGEPLIFVSREDADARGIRDSERVVAYNDVASFQAVVAVSPAVRQGQVIVYHAWENFQFPEWGHFKGVMPSPLNPIELAGGYYHIQATSDTFYPGFSDRDTRVEVRRVDA
jgi:DMSO reductase family type II enzyme molybdopterin subunit